MARLTHPRRAGRTPPAPRRNGQRNPQDDQSKTGWSALAILGRSSQTTSALTSLAQPRAATHQEYKIEVEIRNSRFPEQGSFSCGKLAAGFLASLQAELMYCPCFPRLPLMS